MIEVKFFETLEIDDQLYKYAVIMAKHQDKWIFVRHRERETWEIPGGRREVGEPIFKTAERELIEETGADKYSLKSICGYSVTLGSDVSYGHLYYAEVESFGNTLEHEIGEIKAWSKMPEHLTYPLIQPHLYNKAIEFIKDHQFLLKGDLI